jgi:hypothetical protein
MSKRKNLGLSDLEYKKLKDVQLMDGIVTGETVSLNKVLMKVCNEWLERTMLLHGDKIREQLKRLFKEQFLSVKSGI